MDRLWTASLLCDFQLYDIWMLTSVKEDRATEPVTTMVDDWTQPGVGHRNIGKWIGETCFLLETALLISPFVSLSMTALITEWGY